MLHKAFEQKVKKHIKEKRNKRNNYYKTCVCACARNTNFMSSSFYDFFENIIKNVNLHTVKPKLILNIDSKAVFRLIAALFSLIWGNLCTLLALPLLPLFWGFSEPLFWPSSKTRYNVVQITQNRIANSLKFVSLWLSND